MTAEKSIFEKIAEMGASVGAKRAHVAKREPSLASCVGWLRDKGLTANRQSMQTDPRRDPNGLLIANNPLVLGVPSHRAERQPKADLNALREAYKTQGASTQPAEDALNQLWYELKNPAGAVVHLDIARVPADALAFYNPFHFSPHEEWGIYIMVGPLLRHCAELYESFDGKLAGFNRETLMGCILFEVFHHEFFHHLTECAATSFEIASATFGAPRPLYLNYWECRFADTDGLGPHPDHPLEEALANAYAYNSFSFLSRMEIGQKLLWVRVYQKVLEKCWAKEPPGYCSAATYINAGYVSGAAQLLAMLLASPNSDPASLMLLAKTVMPSGNSAFLQKPDLPTYLVGEPLDLARFRELVPAPNETYTSLFWLGDTSAVDQYLKERNRKEAEAKKKS